MARMWAAHHRENAGDPEGAIEEASKGLALVDDDDGPWLGALLHTLLAGLNAQLGKHEEAAIHALAALPALDELEANDDSIQIRSLLAVNAMTNGDLDVAERYLDEIERLSERRVGFGGAFVNGMARAELRLARGEVAEGLRQYRLAVEELRELRFPGMGDLNGLEPWALFAESAGATAYAVHGSGDEGADLFEALRGKLPRVLDPTRAHMDYPVAGLVLYGLGAWGLLKDALRRRGCRAAARPGRPVRLLALHPDHEPRAHRHGRRAEGARPGRPAPRGVRPAQGPGPPAGGPGRRRSAGRALATSCGCRTAPPAARRSRPRWRGRGWPSRPAR